MLFTKLTLCSQIRNIVLKVAMNLVFIYLGEECLVITYSASELEMWIPDVCFEPGVYLLFFNIKIIFDFGRIFSLFHILKELLIMQVMKKLTWTCVGSFTFFDFVFGFKSPAVFSLFLLFLAIFPIIASRNEISTIQYSHYE